MNKDVQKLMRAFFDAEAHPLGKSCWKPAMDVYQGEGRWLLKFDLAGVRPEDIRLVVDGYSLTIQGIRHDLAILTNQQPQSMEISYNSFERKIELPFPVEHARLTHDFRDGMFLVLIEP